MTYAALRVSLVLCAVAACSSFSAPAAEAQSCGEIGGDYCSQSGGCPSGYHSLGDTYDCSPCCQSDPPPGPSCGEIGGDYCSQSGGCPSGHHSLGGTYDCNPCCKSDPPPGPSCGEIGGDYCSHSGYCPTNYSSLGSTYDCTPCCKYNPPPPAALSANVSLGPTGTATAEASVPQEIECYADADAPFYNEPLDVRLKLYVDGSLVGDHSYQGAGSLHAAFSYTIHVGRSNVDTLCEAEEFHYGMSSQGGKLFPRRRPAHLPIFNSVHDLYSFGNYRRQVYYDIMDNYPPNYYNYSDTLLTESYGFLSNNCGIVQIITSPRFDITVSPYSGDTFFSDIYATQSIENIPGCKTVPDCTSRTRQLYLFDNTYSFVHEVTWRCTDVDVPEPQ